MIISKNRELKAVALTGELLWRTEQRGCMGLALSFQLDWPDDRFSAPEG